MYHMMFGEKEGCSQSESLGMLWLCVGLLMVSQFWNSLVFWNLPGCVTCLGAMHCAMWAADEVGEECKSTVLPLQPE